MPSYKVIETGFFDGQLYEPFGRRSMLIVDKPFTEENMPSWVAELDEQPVGRTTPEKKAPKSIKKESKPDGGVETL